MQKTLKRISTAVIAVLLTSPLLAVDFTGIYKGDITGTGSKTENTLIFQMDKAAAKSTQSSAVTGTLTNPTGKYKIENGSVDGQDIFFNVTIKNDGEDFKLTYRGHLFADEIQFKIEAGERVLDLVAKKVEKVAAEEK